MRTWPLEDGHGSLVWSPDGDRGQRSSTALVLSRGVLLIDPVDVPGLDAEVAPRGGVIGCCVLLDRHRRDADAVAARHGVPVLVPSTLAGSGEPLSLPGIEERAILAAPGWNESALWLGERRLLICADALGTASVFLARSQDTLGVHPLLRLRPPRSALAGLDPASIAVGHGAPLTTGAAGALEHALADARRGLPEAWFRTASTIVRGYLKR